MKTSNRGIELLIKFEGFRGEAYRDVVGVVTIGIGFIRGVKMGDKMTLADARDRLKREIVEYEKGVLAACTRKPNQNQFDAFVCFAFNVGVAGFRKSSVLKAHNRGDYQAAARAFGLWNKAGGKVFAGLTRRRAAEAALYLEPVDIDLADEPEPMPQAVEPERPMTASTINRASVAAGTTATLAAAGEALQAAQGVRSGMQGLEGWVVPALLVVVVALCGYIVWERVNARRQGWM
jgi:lysozyme